MPVDPGTLARIFYLDRSSGSRQRVPFFPVCSGFGNRICPDVTGTSGGRIIAAEADCSGELRSVGLVVVVAVFVGDGRGVGWCGDGVDARIVSLRCNVLLVSS